MIRIANVNDAEQLFVLNNEFNGEGETTLDIIRTSLLNNQQEVVIVDDEDGVLTGFVCVQIKKSFCYNEPTSEITEVYVRQAERKKGIASKMIEFAEKFCVNNYSVHKYEILTGNKNFAAQSLYSKQGYVIDNEVHLSKTIRE